MLDTTSHILRARGVTGPTPVLDESRARANIARMADRARAAGAVFRPHFKTHQSGLVARWFADAGVDRIAVSSLDMAYRFADLGWRDMTVAIPHNPLETGRAMALARHLHDNGGKLGLLVDDPQVTAALAAAADVPVALWVKIDTGYHRTGVPWDDAERLRAVLKACTGALAPAGLLTHAGHSYHARSSRAVQAVYDVAIMRLQAARDNADHPDLPLSFGDTPCCSLVDDLSACDEIRPGNFVFFDLMQLAIGSCGPDDLAAAVACPVIGVYPERGEAVIHGGAVHLSKESLAGPDGKPIYGRLGTATPDGLGGVLTAAPVVSLSQEHGTVRFEDGVPDDLAPGDLVLVWPVHSCLSCDLLRDRMEAPLTF